MRVTCHVRRSSSRAAADGRGSSTATFPGAGRKTRPGGSEGADRPRRTTAIVEPRGLDITSGLAARLEEIYPGSSVLECRRLGEERAIESSTTKATGYGVPLVVRLLDAKGQERSLVFHTAVPNEFGHDRRSDRAQEMLLAYDTFGQIPRHVEAIEVGAVDRRGHLVDLSEATEFYLLTGYAEGRPYADDLRRLAESGRLESLDETREVGS